MYITKHFTRHDHFSSPYETDDTCGNCGGDGCDHCKEIFSVSCIEGYFDNRDDATQALKDLYDLIPLEKDTYEIASENHLFIHNNELYAQLFDNNDKKTKMIPCNKNAKIYQIKFDKAMERLAKYKECKCIDKDSDIEVPCYKYGCTDSSCYRQMKNGMRKDKKYYL
jgi:hypothetical protein